MGLRFGNQHLDKIYFGGKRIDKVYVGTLLVYSIDMFKSIIMDRLYHTPIDGDSVKKSGQVKIDKIEGNGEIVNQLITKPIDSTTVVGLTITNNNDGSVTIDGTPTNGAVALVAQGDYTPCHVGDKLLIFGGNKICPIRSAYQLTKIDSGNGVIITAQNEREPELALHLPTLATINAQTIFPQCVNLTQQFGTGNEPTSLSDNRIKRIIAKGYIPKNNGTYQGTIVQRFEDRGANILDYASKIDGYELINDQVVVNANWYVMPYASVQPRTTYTQSGVYNNYISFFDVNKNFISRVNLATFTTPANCFFIRKDNYKGYTRPMINIGDVALPYVPARWQDFYEEVEYLESTGTQWIDTGFIANQDTRVKMELQVTDLNNKYPIFGARLSGGESKFGAGIYVNGKWCWSYANNGDWIVTSIDVDTNKHTIDANKNSLYIDNNLVDQQTYTTFNTNTKIVLYTISTNGTILGSYSIYKLFSCQIYDNNVLVRDFIPVYRKSDHKPGLYDRANNVFYTNSGTGEFALGQNKRLPEEYREVEYLESTGTQYVDANFIANQDTSIKLDMQFTSSSMAYCGIYGTINANNTQRFELFIDPNDYYEFGYGNAYQVQYRISTDRSIIEQNKNVATVNGQSYTIASSQTFTASNSFYIFNMNRPTMLAGSQMKLYSCKLYDNNVLVRDFVPCYRITDRKPGLYDKINNKFYTNNGTGEFIVGPDVELPAGYQELEYIESTGTQYVDTGVLAAQGQKTSCDIEFLQSTAGEELFGFSPNTGGYWGEYDGKYTGTNIDALRKCHVDFIITTQAHTEQYIDHQLVLDRAFQGTYYNQTLFGVWHGYQQAVGYLCHAKLYNFQLYVNNVLVRSFIPARRLADNEIGLYDKVNDKFYSNQGSGFFIAGPEVNVRTSFMLPQPLKLDGTTYANDTFEVTDTTYKFTRNVWQYVFTGTELINASQFDGVDDYIIFLISTIKAGNVQHLITDYQFCRAMYAGLNPAAHLLAVQFTIGKYANVNDALASLVGHKVIIPIEPQVINISKKHLGYIKLKDLSWNYASDTGVFYSKLDDVLTSPTNDIFYCNQYLGAGIQKPADLENMKIAFNWFALPSVHATDMNLLIKDTRFGTDPVAFKDHFSDSDVLFYETQNEVSDPLMSLPFQKGGELNGQQYEIPVEYQKVEYIESTGTQYIDTGFIANQDTSFYIKAKPSIANYSMNLIGARTSAAADNITAAIALFNDNYSAIADFGNYYSTRVQEDVSDNVFEVYNSKSFRRVNNTINNVVYYQSFNTPSNMYLFAISTDGPSTNSWLGNVYACKIWDNGTLVRNFIPCYRKLDGVIGLYDTVNNVFYVNQGTGTFLKGPDVNQIIDCEVLPNVEVKAQKS